MTREKVAMSWSQWSEFFYAYRNDRFIADVVKLPKNSSFSPTWDATFIISTPVYIIPMITFHIGHVLVDVVESLYANMMRTYGRIRRDALIIIDVSGNLSHSFSCDVYNHV